MNTTNTSSPQTAALQSCQEGKKTIMYTLESLKPLNVPFDSEHRLEQSDVDMVNRYIKLIESTRRDKPCPGDIVEHTDEYGDYCRNAHIKTYDGEAERFAVRIHPFVPCVYRGDDGQVAWHATGGGMETFVDSSHLTYIGKREKLFMAFGHCGVVGNGAVYFKALVNVWEYIAPGQKHPGYTTKDWRKQYISYRENPVDGCVYRYYGQDIAFKNAAELQYWKHTYKAVEFPGDFRDHTVVFHYRENDKLVSREEWNALDLPLDTRFVNGIIHVKVAYDDVTHMINVYRFTNSGYLDTGKFGPYERAKGTALVGPGPEVKGIC